MLYVVNLLETLLMPFRKYNSSLSVKTDEMSVFIKAGICNNFKQCVYNLYNQNYSIMFLYLLKASSGK